jgi:enoyl-CoA hydratase
MSVRVEPGDRIITVILSRPEVRNAVNPEHADALHQAFLDFDNDESAAAAVFWGEGGAFGDPFEPSRLEFSKEGEPIPRGPMGPARLQLGKPVIAAIKGPAVAGGMELALWADCRVMAEGAYMGVYNRRWGVPRQDGGTVGPPRLVGQGRALEIIMTGRKVDAEECLRVGLCERVVPKGLGVSAGLCARRSPVRVSSTRPARERGAGAGMGEQCRRPQGGRYCGRRAFRRRRRAPRRLSRLHGAEELAPIPEQQAEHLGDDARPPWRNGFQSRTALPWTARLAAD